MSWLCWSHMNAGTMFLLTDGTVIVNECVNAMGTRRWWKLSPDNSGSYTNGSWTRIADSNVSRKYFASAVLADGKVIVCGGEYSDGSGVIDNDESNRCEIYDPVADSWSEIPPPADTVVGGAAAPWTKIGDAPCAVLSDGRFFLVKLGNTTTAAFNPQTGTWDATTAAMGAPSSEETWVLMSDGSIIAPQCGNHPSSERYLISTDTWQGEGNLPVELVEFGPNNVLADSSFEIGPGVLLPDGRAFFAGATSNTALYSLPVGSATQGTWAAGPTFPRQKGKNLGCKDGPACLMVHGHVLIPAAPVNGRKDDYKSPCTFFDFDGTSFNRVPNPPNSKCPTYVGRLLLLPTGEILWGREDDDTIYAFNYDDVPPDSFRPVITACPNPIDLGGSIDISGTQFNGLSQAVGYGDDVSAATNYPLVRVKNKRTGDVTYCRTSNHRTVIGGNTVASMAVATGNAVITTTVDIHGNLSPDDYDLFVVANGIPSAPFPVTMRKV